MYIVSFNFILKYMRMFIAIRDRYLFIIRIIFRNQESFINYWDYHITLPASCETYMQVKMQQLEQNMEQKTGSKLGKGCIKAVYCHPVYLIWASLVVQLVNNLPVMQETLVQFLGWEDLLEKQ